MAGYYLKQINKKITLYCAKFRKIGNIEDYHNLSTQEMIALKELQKSIKECLKLLPPEKILYLRYWHNLSIKNH